MRGGNAASPAPSAWVVLAKDLPAGLVVFLVALPLCLGVALASNAPLFSGIIAGIVGGIVVGLLSGSHTSVAGPAAGLTAIVAAQIATLGSFRAVLLATVFAGLIQIALGVARTGFIAAFFPSSVIKGLLAAIGLILILKQIPHVLGHDADPVGNLAFEQPDRENTFTELVAAALDIHAGAALVGIASILLLVVWDKLAVLKRSLLPAPLVVVVIGVLLSLALPELGPGWAIQAEHLVNVPMLSDGGLASLIETPDWSMLANPALYMAAVTLAIVASLETLLNLEAVDRLDPEQRHSPPNRELWAQGVGNVLSGLIGGLPVTSVIVRSSVNVNARNKTRLSAIFHGSLLLGCVLLVPALLNRIPLASLAAILVMTGLKLASPKLIRQMWSEGRSQFMPFAVTVAAIVATDLLKGIGVGLLVAVGFILHSNLTRPLRRVLEKHITGNVLRIELANQVSFLNRAALERALYAVPRGGHVLLDARNTDYIDPDVLDLLDDFRKTTAPAHEVEVSLVGFRDRYATLEDKIQFVDHTSRDVRDAMTPDQVLQLFKDGNRRFLNGERLTRDLVRQVNATSRGQTPLAVVLGCIDSRAPVELIFDLGIGDVFSARIAGNVARDKVLGSIEYATVVAGAKLVLVLGHTCCGAVRAAVEFARQDRTAEEATGCKHIDVLVNDIQNSIDPNLPIPVPSDPNTPVRDSYVDEVARRNVQRTMAVIRQQSEPLNRMIQEGKLALVGGMYDVRTGEVSFFALDGAISESMLSEGRRARRARKARNSPAAELPSSPSAAD
ncbi:MAG TPA: SulP family inorganic anion transporter [Polyangiaceae bacterium]|jgi:carbonic anhydrase/SulP family sulfate permease|nr:SulP family inorganic anion transporter [Polyangiaceae bacterium]